MTSLGSLISSATVSSSLEIVSEGPCEDKRNAGDVSDYVGEDGTRRVWTSERVMTVVHDEDCRPSLVRAFQ